jgi:integrase
MARPATGQVVERDGKRGRTYALRFRAYGKREYLTLGTDAEGWSRARAEVELQNVLADVRRGLWQPPSAGPAPQPPVDPTFHEFASDWYAAKEAEIRPNTGRSYRNDLTHHLLPFFARHRLSEITIAEVDRYRDGKVREGRLGARSINMTLALVAQILEVAVDYGHMDRNPAAGRRRRLKVTRPRPVHLDTAEHLAVLLEAASILDGGNGSQTSGRRAAMATLLFAGLRAEEVGTLRWRDIDLANGRLHVRRAKTDAGVREVDLLPILRDELASHKVARAAIGPDTPVFVTSSGKPRDRHNLRLRVVTPLARKADELLAQRDLPPLPTGLSPHKLRHSFASLLVGLGNDPAYVMSQLGHSDPAFTLRVYAHVMRRGDAEREALRALVEGREWAQMGTNGVEAAVDGPVEDAPEN